MIDQNDTSSPTMRSASALSISRFGMAGPAHDRLQLEINGAVEGRTASGLAPYLLAPAERHAGASAGARDLPRATAGLGKPPSPRYDETMSMTILPTPSTEPVTRSPGTSGPTPAGVPV